MTTTTPKHAAADAPAWANHPTTIVEHECGERVHPEDAGTAFDRPIARWATSSRNVDPAGPATLSVTLHGRRHDQGDNDPDNVTVQEDDTPGLCLTAADARTLGQALLQAADLLDAPGSEVQAQILASWESLSGGRYRITEDGQLQTHLGYEDEWRTQASLLPRICGTAGHYESLVSAVYALQRDDEGAL